MSSVNNKSISFNLRRALGSGKRRKKLNSTSQCVYETPALDYVESTNSCGDADSTDELDSSERQSSLPGMTNSQSMLPRASKSSSLGSINSEIGMDTPFVDQDDIMSLTLDVRGFSDALAKLKCIFDNQGTDGVDNLRIGAHERLGEVLSILKSALHKYPALHSTDVLTSAGTLISKIKGFNYNGKDCDPGEFYDAIDSLALAFSSSVSEYLMGDVEICGSYSAKTRSYENLTSSYQSDGVPSFNGVDRKSSWCPSAAEIDDILQKLDSGVEDALGRAKAWSKYAKDIITYVEKRLAIEADYAKNLSKLAQTTRPILTEESFMPFQSTYGMSLAQDVEHSDNSLATCHVIQTHKFIEPLNARRTDHERMRKSLKDTWTREFKKMNEAITNVRKSRSLYIQRQQEHEKAKEASLKMESEILGQSGSLSAGGSKLEKKKRAQEDAMHKAIEAETTYKSCVVEANNRQQELEKVKSDILKKIRELIYQCDQTMKAVTVSYFQYQHTLAAPAPVQYQTLCENCRLYEPGTQYAEFVKNLPSQRRASSQESFVFEPYIPEKFLENRKRSSNSTGSSEMDGSPFSSPEKPMKAWTQPAVPNSDTESNSSKSHDSSPSASPLEHTRKKMVLSSSMDELTEEYAEEENFKSKFSQSLNAPKQGLYRNSKLSKIAEGHMFRKLRTPSKCRECESYVFYQGAECEKCGLACHKKCLEVLAIVCGAKRPTERRMTTFGVDFDSHLQETKTEMPYIVAKCVSELDQRGLSTKGIYRISGVKSRVEKLCQHFETSPETLDLSEHHPNIIANVLKLYLRQLPQPLTTITLYKNFIQWAKDDLPESGAQSTSANSLRNMKALVQQLPKHNKQTLGVIMHHLKRVTEEAEVNQMCASNLGIVFGPTLLRPSEGSASLNALMDTPYQSRIIETLIVHAEELFGAPESLRTTEQTVVESIQSANKENNSSKVKDTEPRRKSSGSKKLEKSSSMTIGSLVRQVSIPGIAEIPTSPTTTRSPQVSHHSDNELQSSLSGKSVDVTIKAQTLPTDGPLRGPYLNINSNKRLFPNVTLPPNSELGNQVGRTINQTSAHSKMESPKKDNVYVNAEIKQTSNDKISSKSSPNIKPPLMTTLNLVNRSPTTVRPAVPTKTSRTSSTFYAGSSSSLQSNSPNTSNRSSPVTSLPVTSTAMTSLPVTSSSSNVTSSGTSSPGSVSGSRTHVPLHKKQSDNNNTPVTNIDDIISGTENGTRSTFYTSSPNNSPKRHSLNREPRFV